MGETVELCAHVWNIKFSSNEGVNELFAFSNLYGKIVFNLSVPSIESERTLKTTRIGIHK